jgi:hypothetical protein
VSFSVKLDESLIKGLDLAGDAKVAAHRVQWPEVGAENHELAVD